MMRILRQYLNWKILCITLCVWVGCGTFAQAADLTNADQLKPPSTMTVYVTVDWEGVSLDQENIDAMQSFRKRFPNIPVMQLMNPAYFLRDNTDNKRISSIIKSTFLPIDRQGLHVHAWQSLVTHCGIKYQNSPTYTGGGEPCDSGDCGYTVSLEFAYTQAELNKLIACSSDVLVKNGFDRPDHFRAGGWQLGDKLMTALQTNGFVWDSSRIDANLLMTRWHPDSSLVKMLKQLHPNSTPLDQPYAVSAQLQEFPNNAALADYTNTKQIVALFQKLIKAEKKVMVLGFHQETATEYLNHLERAIPKLEAIAKDNGVKLVWGR